jgi:hypothetical protein
LKRRKGIRRILAAVFVIAFYLILFPRPVGKEHFLVPVWVLDLRRSEPVAGSVPVADQRSLWFRLRDRFGYADLEGNLLYQDKMLHDVALSERGFINFARISEYLVFRDPEGSFLYGIPSFGYPLLEPTGSRLYTVSTNLNGIKAWSEEGETIWQAEFFSPLTTISLEGEECLLGLVEGKIMFFGPQGELRYESMDSASRIPVVLGTAISRDAEHLAWISGIDPQRLSLVNRKDDEFSPHFSLDLESDFRREIFLKFSDEGKFLLFESPGGVQLLDLARRRSFSVSLPGVLRRVALASAQDMLALGTKSGEGSALLVFHPLDRGLYRKELESPDLFLKVIDNHLLLAVGDHLLRLDLLEG